MAKNKHKKHEAAEVTTVSGKMSRKEFDKELGKLQVLWFKLAPESLWLELACMPPVTPK
jgi:hypothetical protein